ncbi:response regulator [Uliginosibacterium sp. H3]|uniref:Response regulator n=1 Tax=Uliginosibacterium silvisoli TaxID=3114758 RepID=A0ABU6K159_9RHOO|nr:response regulator [Uliginosibacterium sp. H3]
MNTSLPGIDYPELTSRAVCRPGVPVVRVVDDDRAYCIALHRLLRAQGFEVRSYSSVAEVLLEGLDAPGCFVLDMALPDATGLELQQVLSRWPEPPPVIFLSGQSDVLSVATAMKLGAVDFFSKPVEGVVLVDSVRNALLRDQTRRDERKSLRDLRTRYDALSERERAVLTLAVEGNLNRDIALTLNIAERTVKAHRAHLLEKMQARTVLDLVRMTDRLRGSAQPL